MKTSWKFINKELCKNCKNYGFQSVNINGRSIRNLQSIANAFNPLKAELNPICHLLALLGAHHILHVSRIRVNKHFTTFPTINS
jgi:hypothetical protein